jgi:hypothetical protein
LRRSRNVRSDVVIRKPLDLPPAVARAFAEDMKPVWRTTKPFFSGHETSLKQTRVLTFGDQPTKGDRHVEHHHQLDFLLDHFANLAYRPQSNRPNIRHSASGHSGSVNFR